MDSFDHQLHILLHGHATANSKKGLAWLCQPATRQGGKNQAPTLPVDHFA
jgi:hypothetical protein